MGKPKSLKAYLRRIGLAPQDLVELMRQLQADLEYFNTNYEKFQKMRRYAGRFVAVYGGKVVGWGKDPHRLIYRLRRRGLPAAKVVIKKVYKSGEEPVWIIPAAAAS